jgi:hypothetical protein
VRAVTQDAALDASGVPDADVLVAFTEAMVVAEPAQLGEARERLRARMGWKVVVDAAAVASNFERMVRIADATGIPLDTPVEILTRDIRGVLGVDRFGSAANTPVRGRLVQIAGNAGRPLLRALFRSLGRYARRRTPKVRT